MPAASIIIANWNGKKWLADCFDGLAAQTYRDFEIILVDDGSTDDSAAWVAEHYPHVHLIRQEQHLGFTGANNLGIRAAQGQYIITLNNDTRPEPQWLAELLAGVTGPDVGMVAAQMLQWDNPALLDSAGITVDMAGFGWNLGWMQPADKDTDLEEVFGPCAGAALYTRKMLDQIGLFDGDFYTYYEDVDLAWRARRAGWRCIYNPRARVLHYHSATGGKFSPRKVYLLSRNRLWTILKNYNSEDFWWAWALFLVYEVASTASQLLHIRDLAPLKGRWDALRLARKMWAKRPADVHYVKLVPPQASPFR